MYSSNENSLKLKIKLPPPPTSTSGSDGPAALPVVVSSTTNDVKTNIFAETTSSMDASKVKKKKEVLNYGNMNLLDSIKLDQNEATDHDKNNEPAATLEDPIKKERIIMKLKTNLTSTASVASDSNSTNQAPIKLKLKISNLDSTVQQAWVKQKINSKVSMHFH